MQIPAHQLPGGPHSVALPIEVECDLVVEVDGVSIVSVRCTGTTAVRIADPDPERSVVFALTSDAASALAGGQANAQMLISTGGLQIRGRIDVLQEQAHALAQLPNVLSLLASDPGAEG